MEKAIDKNLPYNINKPVVTMGTFDGVHPGHKALLQKVSEIAKRKKRESVVLTFWPHPRIVLGKDAESLRFLTTPKEKNRLIKECGIDHIVTIPFTKKLATLSAEQFIKKILIDKLNTDHLIIGFNHKFGKGGISFKDLLELSINYNFEVSQFKHVSIDGLSPSSTKIRNHLLNGEIKKANLLLGYPFFVSGEVTQGKKIGRTISYPTANIKFDERAKLIPPDGVYAVYVNIEGKNYKGMANIGIRPTVNNHIDNRSLEVHILDFKKEIYSKYISVHFIVKVREEMKFNSIISLKEQLIKDEKEIRQILTKQSV
ncbi:bifunctional riboflavin kinase/FAD synthetase [Marinilabiliaceae bacterium ANBcel2]|nr:bifunctional riboflavin kinase/FAD synthetase [Marinilabiliaceae bacterium ANBcel2]